MRNSLSSPDDIKFVAAFPALNLCAPAFWSRMGLTEKTMYDHIPRRVLPDLLIEMDCHTRKTLPACAKVLKDSE